MFEVVCWICKSLSPGQLLQDMSGSRRSCGLHMMQYCLNIEIEEMVSVKLSLCLKCCNKLKSFYKFKQLATASFAQLSKYGQDNEKKCEDNVKSECGDGFDRSAETEDNDFKPEINTKYVKSEDLMLQVKQELDVNDVDFWQESDDEHLGALKLTEENNIHAGAADPHSRLLCEPKQSAAASVCDVCGLRVRSLKSHQRSHTALGSRAPVPCQLCDKTFATYSSRRKHVLYKHLDLKQNCLKCNKSVKDLASHELRVHNRQRLPLECGACGKRYATRSQLAQHTSVHTRAHQHVCTQCGATFRLKATMINHKRRVHDGERTFLCDYCSKGFFNKYALTIHLRCHTNERPAACAQCGKRFMTPHGLATHLKRHRDQRDHRCTLCHMAFHTSGALKTHMVTHTKEKRYKCLYCDARFGRSDHRSRHQRTAHRDQLGDTSTKSDQIGDTPTKRDNKLHSVILIR